MGAGSIGKAVLNDRRNRRVKFGYLIAGLAGGVLIGRLTKSSCPCNDTSIRSGPMALSSISDGMMHQLLRTGVTESTTRPSGSDNNNNNAAVVPIATQNNEVAAVPTATTWVPRTRVRRCPAKNSEEITPDRKSQFGEDWDLYEAFNGFCGGTYIEMGALDGVSLSNSHLFSKQFDYHGMLIEMTPSNYELAKVNRPDELAVINTAVCHERTTIHWMEGSRGQGSVNGVWEFTSKAHRKKWWPQYVDSFEGLPTIPCVPMTELMDENLAADGRVSTLVNGKPHYYFDFYSLDVEGAEYSVLQSIDWTRTAFGILLVEIPRGKKEEQSTIEKFLLSKGYVVFKPHHRGSSWFKHPEFDRIYNEPPAMIS